MDVDKLRAETPGAERVVHLNNCGASLMPQPVLDAVINHLRLEAEIGGYEAEAGSMVDWSTVAYWEIMATVRWAIIAHQQGLRHISGAQSSMELALTGRKAAEMEFDVLTQIRTIEDGA